MFSGRKKILFKVAAFRATTIIGSIILANHFRPRYNPHHCESAAGWLNAFQFNSI